MPILYPCFISYRHSESKVVQTFVGQLRDALTDYTGLYMSPARPYMDEALDPGTRYNEALAQYICQSACLVVIYQPTYEESTYCLREYAAMEHLQKIRLEKLGGSADRTLSMIVPIVLRRSPDRDLPHEIGRFSREIHFADFSRYSLASRELSRNREYVDALDRIARHIARVYRMLRQAEEELCKGCDKYALPAEVAVAPWSVAAPMGQAFPFRAPVVTP